MAQRLAENAVIGLSSGAALGAILPLPRIAPRGRRALEAAFVGLVTGVCFTIGAGAHQSEPLWVLAVSICGAAIYLVAVTLAIQLRERRSEPPDSDFRIDG